MPRVLFVLATLLTFSGCIAPPTLKAPLTPALVRDLDARGEDGHFTFYSLREDRIIPVADSASTEWDLAFRSTTILVNGGAVGPGEGGALVLADTTFEAVVEAPEGPYAIDTGIDKNETAIPGGAGNGWYAYDFTSMVVSPRPAVLAVKTADGRYAKVEILSYYLGAPEEVDPEEGFRYYTFRYLFQPDGTRSFE